MARSSKEIQLSELKDIIAQLNMTIKDLNDTIARQQSENDNLKAELAWFRQNMFGSSSERRTDDIYGQLSLFDTSCIYSLQEVRVIHSVIQTGTGFPADVRTHRQNFHDSLDYYSRAGIYAAHV